MTITYVAVGFRTDRTRSVGYYRTDSMGLHLHQIQELYEKGAQFISLRKIEPPDGILVAHP